MKICILGGGSVEGLVILGLSVFGFRLFGFGVRGLAWFFCGRFFLKLFGFGTKLKMSIRGRHLHGEVATVL